MGNQRPIHFMTPQQFLIGYILVASLACAALVYFDAQDVLLFGLIAPIPIAAHYAPRQYYRGALLALALLSIWVLYETSNNMPRSLTILAISAFIVFLTSEGVFQLSQAQRRILARLYASERRFRSIFADAPLAIELFDSDGRLLDVNRAGLAIFGVSSVEAIQGFQLFEDPNVTDEVKQRLRRGETVRFTNTFDFSKVRETGAYETSRDGVAELDVFIAPLGFMENTATEGYLVLAEDVTDAKQMAQQALALRLEKEQTRILTRFIENASHEFRTPLSIISLDLHLLQRACESEPQQRRLARIETQVHTLKELVDKLLTLATLDSDATISFMPLNIKGLLSDLLSHQEADAQAKGVAVHVDLPESLPDLQGSPQYLAMALQSLLNNAISYTPAGGHITVRGGTEGDTLVLSIADTGIGMASEIMPFIFDRFYRLDEARSTEGFGLGLSIAQRVVERHGGYITVESELGKGTCFALHLPLTPNTDNLTVDNLAGDRLITPS